MRSFTKEQIITFILAVFFSIGSWLGIKATFLEEPLLVGVVPEGWRLPSYLVIITQMGNIGPIVYTVLQKFKLVRDSYAIYLLLTIATLASLGFALFHQVTANIFGADRSIAILTSMFGFALVGCSSSVLFMPYMGRFEEFFLVTYLFGEDVSGLLTSLVVMVQGVGGDPVCVPDNSTESGFSKHFPRPRFGITAFFSFVTALMLCSTIAFCLLDRLQLCRTQYSEVTIKEGNNYTYKSQEPDDTDESAKMTSLSETPEPTVSRKNFHHLLFLQGVVCLVGNGILPSIQSYSSLPYGNSAYHLVITLSTIASPVACFLAFFVPHHSIRQIVLLTVFTSLLGVYATVTALMSPLPPLLGTDFGIFLIVTVWTLFIGVNSYIRLSITSMIRFVGGKSLVINGALGQGTGLAGAIISFLLYSSVAIYEKYKMLTIVRAYCKDITKARLVVTTLVLLFSIGSWLGIKATFLEEPLLVGPAPEGWRLPSYLVVITQMGNLGPIIYSLIQKFRPIKDAYYIYGLLIIGVAGSLVMAFFHQRTAYIFGADRSLAIFVAMFGYALIGCSSSVLFMPYMGRFYEIYLITYIFGVDFSGLITSVIVIIQGVGGDPECVPSMLPDGPAFVEYVPPPRFGVKALFIFVTALMMVSVVAFYLLEKLPICKTEYAAIDIKDGNNFTYADNADTKEEATENVKNLSKYNFYYLLIMQAIVCLVGNGILPSIQSFSSLPYGNSTYHLVVTLSTIASPVACFFAFFVPHHSIRQVTALIVFTGILGAYATLTAVTSPTPPLLHTKAGEVLIIIVWTLFIGVNSFIRLSITSMLRFQGGKILVLVGYIGQAAGLLGAVFSFVLVNMTSIFKAVEKQTCNDL